MKKPFLDAITRITRAAEEIITSKDLEALLAKNIPLNHYIGFEISGQIHLGTGIAAMQKVKDIADAGIRCHIFLADWHTWINEKLSGDRELIKKIALGYFKEGLGISYRTLGGNSGDLSFLLGSEIYHHNDRYWETVIEVAKHTTLNRMKRSIAILGRREGEEIDFAKLMYPAMQVADIFAQQIHIAHAGMDQRKAHVIARDVANHLSISPLMAGGERVKPVAVHHHLLLGLQKPPVWPLPDVRDRRELWASLKMSKSNPDSAVFVHDEPEEIARKVKKAFCPEKEAGFNPMLDWAEHIIFSRESSITIPREQKYGGDLTLQNASELKDAYAKGLLHPEDLKSFIASYLIDFLAPIREHFSKGAPREMLSDLKKLTQT